MGKKQFIEGPGFIRNIFGDDDFYITRKEIDVIDFDSFEDIFVAHEIIDEGWGGESGDFGVYDDGEDTFLSGTIHSPRQFKAQFRPLTDSEKRIYRKYVKNAHAQYMEMVNAEKSANALNDLSKAHRDFADSFERKDFSPSIGIDNSHNVSNYTEHYWGV